MNYHFIQNLNLNIRINTETTRMAQAKIPFEVMEELIKNTNSVANNVTMFYKDDSNRDTLNHEQLKLMLPAIQEALLTLISNIENDFWVGKYIQVLYPGNPNNKESGLVRYTHPYQHNGMNIEVVLNYKPNVLGGPFYPERPGAIINHWKEQVF